MDDGSGPLRHMLSTREHFPMCGHVCDLLCVGTPGHSLPQGNSHPSGSHRAQESIHSRITLPLVNPEEVHPPPLGIESEGCPGPAPQRAPNTSTGPRPAGAAPPAVRTKQGCHPPAQGGRGTAGADPVDAADPAVRCNGLRLPPRPTHSGPPREPSQAHGRAQQDHGNAPHVSTQP